MRSIRACLASGFSRTAPLSATITGSSTTGASPTRSSASSTASMVGSSKSIPIFTASTPISETTARTWSRMNCRGSVSTEITSWVFCAVSATIAEVPCTPQRANAFRSAWIPAPPPESEVAIVIAIGMRRAAVTRVRLVTGSLRGTRAAASAVRS